MHDQQGAHDVCSVCSETGSVVEAACHHGKRKGESPGVKGKCGPRSGAAGYSGPPLSRASCAAFSCRKQHGSWLLGTMKQLCL